MKALYNKYRPVGLEAVRGQEHVKRVLANQVRTGDWAHAYIFAGPPGTGKTTCARIFAAMLNCSTGPTTSPPPDDKFVSTILTGYCIVDVLEVDAATNNGVDNIRELRQKAYYAPVEMSHKVYIVDECHRLTPQAWDGLLKIIEEPPEHVVFVFCTTEQEKIPETIMTRCMMLEFRALSAADVGAELRRIASAEGVAISDEFVRMLASASRGSLRQAISWLFSLKSSAGSEPITLGQVVDLVKITPRSKARDFVTAALGGKFAEALVASTSVVSAGGSTESFLSEVANFCIDVMMHGAKGYDWAAMGYSKEEVEDLAKARATLEGRCLAAKTKPVDARRLMTNWVRILQEYRTKTVLNINPLAQILGAYTDMYLDLKSLMENKSTP